MGKFNTVFKAIYMKIQQNVLVHLTWKRIVWFFVLLSIYILVSSVWINIRIPYSLFDDKTTTQFNGCVEGLALNYLGGVIVFYLTVILKYKILRRKRKWELRDAIINLHNTLKVVEENFLYHPLGIDDFKEGFTPEVSETFTRNATEAIKRLLLYEDILTESEINNLAYLQAHIWQKPDLATADEKSLKEEFEEFKRIHSVIEAFYHNINKEVENTPEPVIAKIKK